MADLKPETKRALRALVLKILEMPWDEGRYHIEVLIGACSLAKQSGGKAFAPGEMPCALEGWDECIELCQALKKTVF